jgi:DNA-binding IclR family transcriptional regulator
VVLESGLGDLQVAVPVLDNKGEVAAALSATADGISEDGNSQAIATLARHLARAAETVQGAVADE